MIVYSILEFPRLSSTNDYLKEQYKHLSNYTVVRTNDQFQGRGQFQRTWESEPNQNLLFSVLLKEFPLSSLQKIQNALVHALGKFFLDLGIVAHFKQPNDFFVNDKKICGILVETKVLHNRFEYIIVGIGINVNQEKFDNFIATSIKLEKKNTQDVASLFNKILLDLKSTMHTIY